MNNDLVILEQQFRPLLPQLQQALADRMPVERLMRTIMVSAEKQPKLLACSRQSLFSSAMTAAFLGLEVDGVTGQGYLVPFNDKRLGLISQFLTGYCGMNTLAARSGFTVTADVVKERELETGAFDYELGSNAYVRHKPMLTDAGRIVAAWSCATSKTLQPIVCVLPLADLEAVRERSKAAGKEGGFSPWDDPKIGRPAMYAKTARRRLRRSMPLNAMTRDFHLAARMDEAFEEQGQPSLIRADGTLMIGGTASPLPDRQPSDTPAMGEIIGPKPNAELEDLKSEGMEATEGGSGVLAAWWKRLSPRQQRELQTYKDETLKPMAAKADKPEDAI